MSARSSVVIVGAHGQLGSRLVTTLEKTYDVIALDRTALDLATVERRKLEMILRGPEPVAILNAAAYTAVDRAESEPALAHRINAEIVEWMAQVAQAQGAAFIHFSTDYVFDGERGEPYCEADATRPLSVYGASKRAGEEAALAVGGTVFRLQWVYGGSGQNFFNSMKKLLTEREEVRVVADQIGAPSFAQHIADAVQQSLHKLVAGDMPRGLYHLTAGGSTSWHGFACAIAEMLQLPARVIPITTAEYPLPATRPRDARLDCSALNQYGIAMPHWRAGLAAHIRA